MSAVARIAMSLGLGVVGYGIGLFGGMGLVYLFSGNQHDRSVEAAMTGAFATGPLLALAFAIVAFCKK